MITNPTREDFDRWVALKKLQNPTQNHAVLSRCLFAVLASCYGQAPDSPSPEPTVAAPPHHTTRRRRNRKSISRTTTRRREERSTDLAAMIERSVNRAVSAGFRRVESTVKQEMGRMNRRLDRLEELWEKEAGEQRNFTDYIHRELYAMKGTAYMMRNSTLPSQAIGVRTTTMMKEDAERSMAVREDIGKTVGELSCIPEKGQQELDDEDKSTTTKDRNEADPLEELLNKKHDNHVFGFQMRDKKAKNEEPEEDPIMALLGQEGGNKENSKHSETEPARPKNLMFRMNKGNNTGNPAPSSMDDLLGL